MHACKKKLCSLLSLFPLYKNGGLFNKMHIEIEKKTSSSEVME